MSARTTSAVRRPGTDWNRDEVGAELAPAGLSGCGVAGELLEAQPGRPVLLDECRCHGGVDGFGKNDAHGCESRTRIRCEHFASTAEMRVFAGNERPPFPGPFLVGGTGLEPVTPSLSIWCSHSRQFAWVRSDSMVERKPRRDRTRE